MRQRQPRKTAKNSKEGFRKPQLGDKLLLKGEGVSGYHPARHLTSYSIQKQRTKRCSTSKGQLGPRSPILEPTAQPGNGDYKEDKPSLDIGILVGSRRTALSLDPHLLPPQVSFFYL